MSIEPFTGVNYPWWRKKVNIGLAIFEIDKAITDKRPVEPTHEVIPDDATPEVRVHKEKENTNLMECYHIDKINWKMSNHKCLMVIKKMISALIQR
jgi:hypothetical protein